VSLRARSGRLLRDERGYTMIELLIAMSMGTLVAIAAFSFLQFTTSDVTRINERAHLDQTGRVALERIMLRLHSACVAPSVAPIQPKSNENNIKFVSEAGAEPSFITVDLHEIIFSHEKETLIENTYVSTNKEPPYTFPTTPASTTTLLTGVKESQGEEGLVHIFRYYRYYISTDPPPTGSTTVPYGELNPTALSFKALEKESETKNVAKVTMSFTLAPTGKESATFNHDRPVPLEDSVVFRLAPSSELSTTTNLPCSPAT
jgi:prepilin-type N-terminal cleavage/methylation domain-containing protein